jgi:hypothetical protein
MSWIWKESPFKDDFLKKYNRAREEQADYLAEEMLEISDEGMNDYIETFKDGSVRVRVNDEHISRSRLRVDTRKWIASKLKPKKYGDKIQSEVSGPDGAPLVPVAPTAIIFDFTGETK